MSLVAAIGESARVAGYALAGVAVHAAGDAEAVREAWKALSNEVACVIMTSAAHSALGARLDERPDVIRAVVPD
ncbi:MAG: V-type ATP synthase subunit F [Solirubrobacteraceae bacterium]